ncbi:MAG: hypothetical protein H6830_10465 [Planctomycetes bacterium]|nr:hypothetical protein [Planctomycetota bacterium]MCB9912497.1 hypothetical protein [Planctomycetota bacterium]HRV80992.1 hypothetical protein [Planctomycetota bacterium]
MRALADANYAMSIIAILSLAVLSPCPPIQAGQLEQASTVGVQDDDVTKAIRAAGQDVAKLIALATSYEEASKPDEAKRVYQRVIEIDVDNELARKALRHERYDGRWFESYVELARYKREEAKRMKAKGLVSFEDGWVPEADLPFLRMGWVHDDKGAWVHPGDLAQAKKVAEWEAAGYQFRPDDFSWIAPEDLEKWAALLWKCGDEWLPTEQADAYHSNVKHPWVLAGEHFEVSTTCPWSYGNAARWHADQVQAHMVRLFGMAPNSKPEIAVMRSLDQYNAIGGENMLDADGLASLHGAYFADSAVDGAETPPRFVGMGISYWAVDDPNTAPWGPYWIRWAAAQSFVDAIDPSWVAVSQFVLIHADPNRNLQEHGKRFWSEKKVPRWLRYGAASYVERFLPNPEAADESDRWTLRSFAFDDLKKSGGLRKLDDVFQFSISLDDSEGSGRLYNEAGLIVSYLLDGAPNDTGLNKALKAFQTSLASGTQKATAQSAKTLEAELKKREAAIRTYAGL